MNSKVGLIDEPERQMFDVKVPHSGALLPIHYVSHLSTSFQEHLSDDTAPPICVVFIHGLSGALCHYYNQFGLFENYLANDYVGHGFSTVSRDKLDYKTNVIADTVIQLMQKEFQLGSASRKNKIPIVLICHSYGSVIGTLVHKKIKTQLSAVIDVKGIVYLTPKIRFRDHELKSLKWVDWIPVWLFNIFRFFDKRGGIHSSSIKRYLGPHATDEIKQKQLEFNSLTPTCVFLDTIRGIETITVDDYKLIDTSKTKVIAFVGGADTVTPSDEIKDLKEMLNLPDTSIVSYDCGHGIMYESSDLLNPALVKFVSSL